jgi:hypothetical protein
MDDRAFADEVIERLNDIVVDPDVAQDVGRLILYGKTPISSKATLNHKSIQCPTGLLGFLGQLNGIVGTIDSGPRESWGFIVARFEGNRLIKFERTKEQP